MVFFFRTPTLHRWFCIVFFVVNLTVHADKFDRAYDKALQFHPNGRVLMVEYAKGAVSKGEPIVGCRCSDGVILVCVRKAPMSKFLVRPVQKVFPMEQHIVVAATGLLFDAQKLLNQAKRRCILHKNDYDETIPVEMLCEHLSSTLHRHTTGPGRPYGVGLLVAGYDKELGPQLYQLDPEGGLVSWNVVCLGQQSSKVMKTLAETFGKPLAKAEEPLTSSSALSSSGPAAAAAAMSIMTVEESLPRLSAALRKHYPFPPATTSTMTSVPSQPNLNPESTSNPNNPCDSDSIFNGDAEGEEGWDLEIHTLLLSQGLTSESELS